jgi:hypothetical protein
MQDPGILPEDGAIVEITGERIPRETGDDSGYPEYQDWSMQDPGILPEDGAIVEIVGQRIPNPVFGDTRSPFVTSVPLPAIAPIEFGPVVPPDFLYPQSPQVVSIPASAPTPVGPTRPTYAAPSLPILPVFPVSPVLPVSPVSPVLPVSPTVVMPAPTAPVLITNSGGRARIPFSDLPYGGEGSVVPKTQTPGSPKPPINWFALALIAATIYSET